MNKFGGESPRRSPRIKGMNFGSAQVIGLNLHFYEIIYKDNESNCARENSCIRRK